MEMKRGKNNQYLIGSIAFFIASAIQFFAWLRETGNLLSFLAALSLLTAGIVSLRRWLASKK
jgi:hypothetical protein